MQKRLTLIGNILVAEVFHLKNVNGDMLEVLVDSKDFNDWKSLFLNMKPTSKTYDKANKWADNVIKNK